MARKSPDIITDLFTLTEQKDASIRAQKRKTKAAVFSLDPDVLTRPEAAPLNLRRDTQISISRATIVEATLVTAFGGLDRY